MRFALYLLLFIFYYYLNNSTSLRKAQMPSSQTIVYFRMIFLSKQYTDDK